MPRAKFGDVELAYLDVGEGYPLVWCHELAGSMESWLPQTRYFARRYRVIAYNARGYPPSDVPTVPDAYSQDQAVEDLRGLLRHLGIEEAHVGGLSMGAATALHFGLRYPAMARSLVIAGVGTGSTDPEQFRERCEANAKLLDEQGMAGLRDYALGSTRIQFRRKDPHGWQEFFDRFMEHSPVGKAATLRGVQGARPPIFDFEEQLSRLDRPTLVIVGDEDDPCIEPSIFLKRVVTTAALLVLPKTGHTINLEEPEAFNRAVSEFLATVEAGRWRAREAGTGAGLMDAPRR
jgi:pimeloyl-ACP methyl ester carboxylesterase